MNNFMYKTVHTLYAYTVASALGMLLNAALLFLAYTLFTSPESKILLDAYGSNNGLYFVVVTLLLGLLFFPFTIKLKVVGNKNT